MKTHTLEVTEEEAAVIAKACRIYAQLCVGQYRDAMECLPIHRRVLDNWESDLDWIGEILGRHRLDGANRNTPLSVAVTRETAPQKAWVAWDVSVRLQG